jgi:hypothetical protein
MDTSHEVGHCPTYQNFTKFENLFQTSKSVLQKQIQMKQTFSMLILQFLGTLNVFLNQKTF